MRLGLLELRRSGRAIGRGHARLGLAELSLCRMQLGLSRSYFFRPGASAQLFVGRLGLGQLRGSFSHLGHRLCSVEPQQ